jgi:hypothetical protein
MGQPSNIDTQGSRSDPSRVWVGLATTNAPNRSGRGGRTATSNFYEISDNLPADDADRNAGQKITSPLLVLWGIHDDLADLYDNDVLGIWEPWAAELTGHGLDSAHHIAEEAPQELTHALLTFFRHTVR